MRKLLVFTLYWATIHALCGQYKPLIMLVPYTQAEQSVQEVLDKDAYKRVAIAKISTFLEIEGFQMVDFVAKQKIAQENHAFTLENQHNTKIEIIAQASCDIYIVVDVSPQKANDGTSVQVNLRAFEANTGASLVTKSANSGKFYTEDISRLSNKAIDLLMPDFRQELLYQFERMANIGKSISLEISISKEANVLFSTEMPEQNMPLADIIEAWLASNSFKGNYHISGVVAEKMIVDMLKIPFSDAAGKPYTSNHFALSFYQFLKKLGLNPVKEWRGNAVFITLK